MKYIVDKLIERKDDCYRDFNRKLIPNIEKETFIGVRIPELRKLSGEIVKEGKAEDFIRELPHTYYEENQLHSFIVDKKAKTFEEAITLTEQFLPYIDNWAVCDSFKPAALKQNFDLLYEYIKKWLKSEHPYTVRYGVVLLLSWFLTEHFQSEMLNKVAEINSDEYYVNMAIAWYYSMALVKQYEDTIPLFEERRLSPWIHKKSIQKAIESRQIDGKKKEHLRSLK